MFPCTDIMDEKPQKDIKNNIFCTYRKVFKCSNLYIDTCIPLFDTHTLKYHIFQYHGSVPHPRRLSLNELINCTMSITLRRESTYFTIFFALWPVFTHDLDVRTISCAHIPPTKRPIRDQNHPSHQ